jgi:8-oxo-dGTP pyrophosphatase MutT (NUDIX family)
MDPEPVEIVGGFDADGAYLGPVARPVIRHPAVSGVYGQAGHVFLVGGGEVAVAVRSRAKASWPGGLDFTAAGVSAPGETPLLTALREAQEELGLELVPARLRLVLAWVPRDGYCSRAELYAYPWDRRRPVPFNADDIEEVRWLPLAELVEAARAEEAGTSAAAPMKTDLRRFLLSDACARDWVPLFS